MTLLRRTKFTGALLLAVLLLAACDGGKEQSTTSDVYKGQAAQALQKKIEDNPVLKDMLAKSIALATRINPDTASNPAQTVAQFLALTERMETSLPWALNSGDPAKPSDEIFAALVAFYFVLDQPLPELEGKGLYRPTLQYHPPFAEWLRIFNTSWRRYLDSEASWNADATRLVRSDPKFGLQNGWYEDPSNWRTFNQFFARYLSSPAARPIASPDDDAVVVSYADAVPMGIWAIDSSSDIMDPEGVAIKSMTIGNVAKLIGDGSMYKDAFANGTFTHSFLNVNDYHRYHFPMAGTIREARIIQGINPTGGEFSWDPDRRRVAFDPSPVGWQALETRGCVILETEDYGLIALLPIGMGAVGSVNFESDVKPGTRVKKGDMLGYFLFGGSDFIMLFQDKVEFAIDSPEDSQGYKHLLMGAQLGHVTKR